MNLTYVSNQLVKKLSVVAATTALSLSIGNAALAATFFTNPENGNKYFLTNATTWTEAQAQAVEAGGNLVTINNAAEQNWLTNTFGEVEVFWTGLTDAVEEDTFQWISGQAVTYTNWYVGEPNDSNGGEDYVAINWVDAGAWNDLRNYGPRFSPTRGIAEIEAASVPEPATLGGILLIGAAGAVLKKKKAQSV